MAGPSMVAGHPPVSATDLLLSEGVILLGAAVLFVLWLICAWMWKRGIFLKI